MRSLFEADDEEKRKLAAWQEANPTSTVNSANNSENEIERDEIMKAQMMAVQLTDVFSDAEAKRSVRVVYRGDFTRVLGTAVEEHKTLRKYLVATDMSEHSQHALEWAVGTVLRDGDTLVVVRCIDEESEEGAGGLAPPPVTAHRASSISVLTGTNLAGGYNGGDSGSAKSMPMVPEGGSDKPEGERSAVVEDLTAKVSKLLRRTKLQVRVIVEVIHCRNPKHLVLEMIDLIKPTLVILGSRGRSAIKG
ncbi:MAG: universal stress protein [Acidobacteria bacterium]|nr:universal stress protein [Acidobacteriota bacterium]